MTRTAGNRFPLPWSNPESWPALKSVEGNPAAANAGGCHAWSGGARPHSNSARDAGRGRPDNDGRLLSTTHPTIRRTLPDCGVACRAYSAEGLAGRARERQDDTRSGGGHRLLDHGCGANSTFHHSNRHQSRNTGHRSDTEPWRTRHAGSRGRLEPAGHAGAVRPGDGASVVVAPQETG